MDKKDEEIERLKADIEYYKNHLTEIEDYYKSIIDEKDDIIADLQDDIMLLRYRN